MRSLSLLTIFFLLSLNVSGQTFIMDGSPVDACSGFFTDSGGGSGDYGPNENFTTTICSDGSSGTHIQLVFSGVDIAAGDQLCFFDGSDVTAPQLGCHDDFDPGEPFIAQATAVNTGGCLTVTFNSNGTGQSAGWSADLNCIPSCQTILASFVSTDPVVSPPDTGYIDVCPGDRVFLNAEGIYPQDGIIYNHSDATSSFFWDFGDGSTAVGPNTSHIYEESGGYIIQLTIEDQLGCKNSNFISQRVRVSTLPDFTLAENLPDELCTGDTISLSANVASVDSTSDVSVVAVEGGFPTGGVRSDSLALPDGVGTPYSTSIVFDGFSPGQTLTSIDDLLGVCVNMEHSFLGDLQIELTCPDGTTVVLQQFITSGGCFLGEPIDGDGTNPIPGVGYDYCWTSDAPNPDWITYCNQNGGTLPAGDYSAFGNLEDFLGCPLNGEWTITITDLWASDNGYIFEWSIDFNPDLYPDLETFTPEIIDWTWEQNSTLIYHSNDSIVAELLNAGNPSYTFSVTNDYGCTSDTTLVVNVLPPTHPSCYSCETDNGPENSLSDSTICNGDMVMFDASPDDPLESLQVPFAAFSNTEFDASTFPPGSPIESAIEISYINPLVLTDITQIESVCFNIEHSSDGDVEVRLQAPNGTIIELTTDNGGNGDDYTSTCFTPTAINPITGGTAPFTGDWQPEGNWADLIGSDINGPWTLLVADDQNGFSGTFLDWTITFNMENEANYFWTNGASLSCDNCPDPTASPSVTTEYIVNGVDFFGCTISDTVTIEVLSAFPAPSLVCGLADSGNLTIDWAAIPGATDYEVSLDGGATWIPANGILSHTISGLSNGDGVNILVQVVSNNSNCPPLVADLECFYVEGCSMVLDTSATIPPSCWNTMDASVFLSTSNAQSPVTYSIDGGADQGPNITGVSAGVHTVIATDDVGCMDTITFTITSPDTIFLTLATDSISCNGECDGQSVAMATGGTGGINYVWNTVPATFDATAANLCFGNYAVTATDGNGCSISDNTTIPQPINLLITSIITNNITCFGAMNGDITITPFGGSPPYSYQWDDPMAQTTATASNLGPGVFNVTVTDNNGCTVIGNAGVFEPMSTLMANVVQTVVGCNGAMAGEAQVNPTGGTQPYTFEWSNGDLTDVATSLDGILYDVTVTDANGCTAVPDITITELDPIVIVLDGNDPICFGGMDGDVSIVSVNGGAGGFTFEWNTNPPQTGMSLSNVPGGTYILTVTDMDGCSAMQSIVLDDPNAIQITMSSNDATCNNFNDGEALVANVSGGMPGYTYQWDNNAGNQTTQTATNLSTGTYFVTVSDVNGCSSTASVDVSEPNPMTLVLNSSDNFCPGQNDGFVNLQVIGGTPNYTYLWEDGETTQNIDSLYSGTYLVTVTDGNGCFVIDSAAVNGPPPLQADIDVEAVSCFGENDGSIVITLNGGQPPYQFSTDNIEFSGSNILIGLVTGDYNLYAVDGNGCTWASQAFVDSPDEFSVNAGDDEEITLGETIQLSPSQSNGVGSVDYSWSEPYVGTLDCPDLDSLDLSCDRPNANPENTITYEVYGVDDNGCEDTDFIRVRVLKDRDVYVPTGFTPNGDGTNDVLQVHGPEGTVVKMFRVFDRWGDLVYEYNGDADLGTDPDILVNDPVFGWDGNFREQAMNPAVFVWYVEVEYVDGFRDIFKGNTTLIR